MKMKSYDNEENENTVRLHRGQHTFTINPRENSGQTLTLRTDITVEFTRPREQDVTLDQELCLQSYGNMATIVFQDLTPAKLRLLADELEKEIKHVIAGTKK